jgi:septum formation protein
MSRPDLVLASGSHYRADLLRRLGLEFLSHTPHIDESQLPGEAPADMVARLAQAKAAAVSARFPDALVIGSDQAADLGGRALGKPGSAERAIEQLKLCAGQSVVFHTAVCLRRGSDRFQASFRDRTEVLLRTLTEAEIARYVEREPALDCAGSFKAESLGISLFEAIHSEDPTALIGLPLIGLCRLLRQAGVGVP